MRQKENLDFAFMCGVGYKGTVKSLISQRKLKLITVAIRRNSLSLLIIDVLYFLSCSHKVTIPNSFRPTSVWHTHRNNESASQRQTRQLSTIRASSRPSHVFLV